MIVSVDSVPDPVIIFEIVGSFEERFSSRRPARVLVSFRRRPSAAHTSVHAAVHVSVHAAVHAFLRVILRAEICPKKEQSSLYKCTPCSADFSARKLVEKKAKKITNISRRALALSRRRL